MMIGILVFVILLLCIVGHFATEQQRDVYERMIRQLEHDRDQARTESQVFRRLVIPNFARAEALTSAAAAPPNPPPTSEAGARAAVDQKGRPADNSSAAAPSNRTGNPAMNRRIPFRQRFKMLTAQHNTPQQKTNTLADAILAAAKKKEQSNVAS